MSKPRAEQVADTLWRAVRPHLVELLHTAEAHGPDSAADEERHIEQRANSQLARYRQNLAGAKTRASQRAESRRKATS